VISVAIAVMKAGAYVHAYIQIYIAPNIASTNLRRCRFDDVTAAFVPRPRSLRRYSIRQADGLAVAAAGPLPR